MALTPYDDAYRDRAGACRRDDHLVLLDAHERDDRHQLGGQDHVRPCDDRVRPCPWHPLRPVSQQLQVRPPACDPEVSQLWTHPATVETPLGWSGRSQAGA